MNLFFSEETQKRFTLVVIAIGGFVACLLFAPMLK